jgi:transcriptional regulator with XRE-family HTH domain
MKLGQVIAAYRRDKNLSLHQLAKQIGIGYTTLWRLESGKCGQCKQWPAVIRWLFSD